MYEGMKYERKDHYNILIKTHSLLYYFFFYHILYSLQNFLSPLMQMASLQGDEKLTGKLFENLYMQLSS